MNKNEQMMAQKIRDKYTDKTPNDVERLRELDAKVRRPAAVFAYIYGSISAVIMGAGMSLIMTDIADIIGMSGDAMILGLILGIAGMAMALLTYPLYKGILASRKRKYGSRVLELSNKIINQ